MNIEIVGGGSIGLLLMAKLLPYSPDIKLITRTKEQADVLKSASLLLEEDEREETRTLLHTYSQEQHKDGQTIDWPTPDWILLAVKQKSFNDELLNLLGSRIGPNSNILCFQNGLGHLEKLADFLPNVPLYAAVTTEGAKKLGHNRVAHTGRGETWLGKVEKMTQTCTLANDSQKKLLALLVKAGFFTNLSNEIINKIWSKLIINSVINPITAILKLRNGQLLEQEATVQLMRSLYNEAKLVAAAEGIVTPDDLWEQIVLVCKKTSANHSSMLQDLQRGNVTEIKAINGSILRFAERHRISAAVHQTVYHMVVALQRNDEITP